MPSIARIIATPTPINQLRTPCGGPDLICRISRRRSAETSRLTSTPRRINAVPIQSDSPLDALGGRP